MKNKAGTNQFVHFSATAVMLFFLLEATGLMSSANAQVELIQSIDTIKSFKELETLYLPTSAGPLNPTLQLVPVPGSECARPGDTITIQLNMLNLDGFLAAGFQAFLEFNDTQLMFLNGAYTATPFGAPIIAPITAVNGDIDLAAGIIDGVQLPTSNPALLATLYFEVLNILDPPACETTVIRFRDHFPPTRISDEFGIEAPGLVTIDSPAILLDGQVPSIVCPGTLFVECQNDIPLPDVNLVIATDTCDPDPPFVEHVEDVDPGGPCPRDIIRTYRATDCAGNSSECKQIITLNDITDPVITCPMIGPFQCPEDVPPVSQTILDVTAKDNCDVVNISFVGEMMMGTNPVVITRTYRATDQCGNTDDCDQVIILALDTTRPMIICPLDLQVNATAIPFPDPNDDCSALVNPGVPTINENCAGPVTVVGVRNDGLGLNDPYPSGQTQITWTATDSAGNSQECVQTITVSDKAELIVRVELAPTGGVIPFTRCITFKLHDCWTGMAAIVKQELEFTQGEARNVLVLVPCGRNFNCITAQDEQHTLRRTDSGFTIINGQYHADFADEDFLPGGDLDNNGIIDAEDQAIWVSQLGTNFGTGDTTCTDSGPHADLNGDGVVDGLDLNFIIAYWQQTDEPNCCGAANLSQPIGISKQPAVRLSRLDLARTVNEDLFWTDLKRDGWLDHWNSLELLHTNIFVAEVNESWFDPSNWQLSVVPNTAATVSISHTVVVEQPGANAGHILLEPGSRLVIDGGSLDVASITISPGGSLIVQAGSLMVEEIHVASQGVLMINKDVQSLDIGLIQAEEGAEVLLPERIRNQ